MRISFPLVLALLLAVGCTSNAPQYESPAALYSMVQTRDYLGARKILDEKGPKIPVHDSLYLHGTIQNALFDNEASIESMEALLANHRADIGDSLVSEALGLLIDSHLKAFQYKAAGLRCDELLADYEAVLDSETVLDFENLNRICKGLQDLPPQKMEFHHAGIARDADLEVAYQVDQVGLKRIPVGNSHHNAHFVFDTGANFSTISQSSADSLGIRPLANNIEVGASTGLKVSTQFGVADSLWIDSLLFQHIVFIVLPDADLEFAQINYKIEGIIGFPVIAQMGRFTLDRPRQTLVVHGGPPPPAEPNMVVNSLDVVLEAESELGRHHLFFDTGAKYSDFSQPFFLKHRAWVEENGTVHSRTVGGAGGMVQSEVYTLYDFSMRIAGQDIRLDSVDVATDERDGKYYDGAVGQSTISKFDRLTMDFHNCRLTFE